MSFMAVISRTRNGMIGKCGKPFCGDCCAWFRQGSGKAWKRRGKHVEKRREGREFQSEVDAELIEHPTLVGCSAIEPCGERWCHPCNLDNEFRNGELCA